MNRIFNINRIPTLYQASQAMINSFQSSIAHRPRLVHQSESSSAGNSSPHSVSSLDLLFRSLHQRIVHRQGCFSRPRSARSPQTHTSRFLL